MLGTPKVWLFGFAALALVLFVGAAHLRYRAMLSAVITASEGKGTAVADSKHATVTLEAAAKAADAERAAEAETPLAADLAYYRKLCGQSASCRSREKYK